MSLIIKIARNELRNLFYSPIAWFLAISFLVMCGFFYTNTMFPLAKWMAFVNKNYQYDYDTSLLNRSSWTASIFSEFAAGVFYRILPNIYLFIPLLTMGVIGKEINDGTIRLLYSSPIRTYHIVLGKYLALMVYNLLLVGIIGIFIGLGFFDIRSPDYGPLLSACLGFYLLMGAFTAIGLYMSSLTTYSVVAAAACFTVLFILMNIGGLWQQYDLVRDITFFLSINNRVEAMISGLIKSKDIIYYAVIICMFIGFTLLRLIDKKEISAWYVKTGRYFFIIAAGIFTGYIGSRPRFIAYWDVTARSTNTLRPSTQNVFNELRDSTLDVTLYTNLLDPNPNMGAYPQTINTYLNTWEQYLRFKPDINFKYEYFYANDPKDDTSIYKTFPGKSLKEIAGLQAKIRGVDSALFKSAEEIDKLADLRSEDYRSIIELKYKGKKVFLRELPSAFSEQENSLNQVNYNAAFKRLVGTKMPKVYFLTGELERSIHKKGLREYYRHTIAKDNRMALVNLGFDVDTLNLMTQDIPPDITILAIADPKRNLDTVVHEKLKKYINSGGNMLILGEPGKQYVLNPLLKQLGVQLMSGQLVHLTFDETPDKVMAYFTPSYFNLEKGNDLWFYKFLLDRKIYFKGLSLVPMPGTCAISSTTDSGFSVTALLSTKPLLNTPIDSVWLKSEKLIKDSIDPVFNAGEGDLRKDSFNMALQLSRPVNGREQRIIVCGDADFLSRINTAEGTFSRSFYSWLDYNEFPIDPFIPLPKDNRLTVTPKWALGEKILFIWLLPGILILCGTILLIRRKRK